MEILEVQIPEKCNKQEVAEGIAVYLYEKGILTQTQAGELIHRSLREFHNVLVKYGYPTSGSFDKEKMDIYSKNIGLDD